MTSNEFNQKVVQFSIGKTMKTLKYRHKKKKVNRLHLSKKVKINHRRSQR